MASPCRRSRVPALLTFLAQGIIPGQNIIKTEAAGVIGHIRAFAFIPLAVTIFINEGL